MRLKILIICFIVLFLASCGSKKRVVKKEPTVVALKPKPKKLPSVKESEHVRSLKRNNANLNKYTLNYIEKYASIAVREMYYSKIPASITLAQGILESGNGRSELATKSKNHFGIKCHTKWKGERVYHDDDEKGECFRKYQFVETSYKDHSEFLTNRKRYAFLFDYNPKDYKKWARGLKKAGYATDKKYPQKIINIIDRYKLYEFDKVKRKDFVLEKRSKEKSTSTKFKNQYYQVKKGDTLYSLARRFNTTVAALKKINKLKSNTLSIGQRILLNK